MIIAILIGVILVLGYGVCCLLLVNIMIILYDEIEERVTYDYKNKRKK